MGNSASNTAETQWHASSTAQRVAILELSNTEDTFLVPPPGADSSRASRLEDYKADINALRHADPQLCRMHVALVTGGAQRISSIHFWSSYLAHVARVRRSEEFATTGLGDTKMASPASALSPIPIHSPAVPNLSDSHTEDDLSAVNFTMEDFDAAETDVTADATLASFLSSSDDDETIIESHSKSIGLTTHDHALERDNSRDLPSGGQDTAQKSGQSPEKSHDSQVQGQSTFAASAGSTSSAKDRSSEFSNALPDARSVPGKAPQSAAKAAGSAAVVAAAAAAEAGYMTARAILVVARTRLVATAALVQQSAPPASVIGCKCHALPNSSFLRAKSRVVTLARDVQSAHAAEAAAASISSSWASVGKVKALCADVVVESRPAEVNIPTNITKDLAQAKARARALKQAGRINEAVDVMREATKAHARALKNAGRIDEAIAVMRAAKARERMAGKSVNNPSAGAAGFSIWRLLGLK